MTFDEEIARGTLRLSRLALVEVFHPGVLLALKTLPIEDREKVLKDFDLKWQQREL